MNKLAMYTAALISLGVVSQACGANTIYITGSTAFRGNVDSVLRNVNGPCPGNGGGVFDAPGPDSVATYGNATASKGTYALYHGNIGGNETYIDVFWSGSEAGIAAVAGVSGATLNDGAQLAGVPVTFLIPDKTVNPNGNSSSLPTSAELMGAPVQPDLCFADTSQAVSLTQPVGANKLTDYGIVGIVPFVFAKGNVNNADAAWGRFQNITIPQANLLLANPRTADLFNAGSVGGSYDYDHTVYLLGRNKGSGTRVNALIACGYGIGTPVVQWAVSSTVGTSAAGLYGLYFVGGAYSLVAIPHTASDINDPDNGYEGGGDVSKALNLAAPANYKGPLGDGNNALTVGYLGVSDATANGLTIAANWLTFNGVAESDGAVESGTYSFYGHEHLLGKNVPTNPAATALVPHLFDAIHYLLENNDTLFGNQDNLKADPSTLHSTGILGLYMYADKNNQGDTGYPVPGAAVGHYTTFCSGGQ